mmetsp:Transcript_4106/g.4684  ORF Transcript_4106/g.4684 Transcript_4106/m.4684 type:complete len:413 (+) Transcript_4106:86-1324(+)
MLLNRYLSFAGVALTAAPAASAFGVVINSHMSSISTTNLHLSNTPPTPDPERIKQMVEEESRNPESMKASAEMLKNLQPEDIDAMLRQMDNMPPAQRKQMEAMGMNPDLMRQSVEMMKANPQMAKQMSNMMETMTPEEIMEKSRQSQANFEAATTSSMTPPSPPSILEAQLVDDEEEETDPIPPPDTEVLDTLYRMAEIMSSPPTGKVTLAGFSTIPPVALLVGNDDERDLSKNELYDCWADGSLGSARVDRAGFERVWIEVQEYFSLPVMDKARERTVEQIQSAPVGVPQGSAVSGNGAPQVGQAISSEQLEQVKNMSDSDMDAMFGQMKNMSPEVQDRMKAMGVDPKMMQKTAEMMNSNPLMKDAAKMMMKNMSPDQMKMASQQAQDQMSKMTPEKIQEAMDKLEKQTKE